MTVRSTARSRYAPPRKYTPEELAEAQRLDDLADAEFEARGPEREAAKAAERERVRAYFAAMGAGAYVPPPDEPTVVLIQGLGGLGYEHQGKLWRFVVEGSTVGPHFATRRAMLAAAREYAVDYGLSVEGSGESVGEGADRAGTRHEMRRVSDGLWVYGSVTMFHRPYDRRDEPWVVEWPNLFGGTERRHARTLREAQAVARGTSGARRRPRPVPSAADRAVPRAARRFAPSREFLAVIRSDGPGKQVAVVARDPSLTAVREIARRAADDSGMPVDVLDDGYHVVATYGPMLNRSRAGHGRRECRDRA